MVTASSIPYKRAHENLPLELWLEIFQFATHVPRATSIAPLDPFTPQCVSRNPMGPNTPTLSIMTKCALVLVCRSWRKVAITLLYEHIVISSPRRANLILTALQGASTSANTITHEPTKIIGDHESDGSTIVPILHRKRPRDSPGPTRSAIDDRVLLKIHDSEYGQWTRHIEIYTHSRGANLTPYLQTIFRIFQHCRNVRMLSGTWIHTLPPKFLDAIAYLYGPTLAGLSWAEAEKSRAPPIGLASLRTCLTSNFLSSFTSLRILDLRNFPGSDDLVERSKPLLPRAILSSVEHLIISTFPLSLVIAELISLPALRALTLEISPKAAPIPYDLLYAFLKVHGPSLISIDVTCPPTSQEESEHALSLPQHNPNRRQHINPSTFLQPQTCPNLQSLTFPIASPIMAPLPSPGTHNSLRRIGLRGVKASALDPFDPSAAWSKFPPSASFAFQGESKSKPCHTKRHLLSFTRTVFPSLEVIRTVGCSVDAEPDVPTLATGRFTPAAREWFMWWADRFENEGVDFQDGEGVLWLYADADVNEDEGWNEREREDGDGVVRKSDRADQGVEVPMRTV